MISFGGGVMVIKIKHIRAANDSCIPSHNVSCLIITQVAAVSQDCFACQQSCLLKYLDVPFLLWVKSRNCDIVNTIEPTDVEGPTYQMSLHLHSLQHGFAQERHTLLPVFLIRIAAPRSKLGQISE